jgi:Transposase DDE domain/Insertion element 4 transposase N-terminal
MSHGTRRRLRDQINLFRDAPEEVPFADLLDPKIVKEALDAEGVRYRDRIFTPVVVLWTFLSQVLSTDQSCRKAVSRLITYLTARGKRACEPDTGAYCKARGRLPVGVIQRLVRKIASMIESRAKEHWLWKGREVVIADGTTASMPDTEANQKVYPQQKGQAPGLGFPIARIVALISLSTGVLRDLATGPIKGKETGETALFRKLMDSLKRGVIVLGDRCFGSFFAVAELGHRGVDGLFRMHQQRKVDFRRGRRLGVRDHVVYWVKPDRPDWMDKETYAKMPNGVWVREIRVKVEQPGFRPDEIVLATTLLDPELYTTEEIADLFLKRWNIELDLRSIKIEMQMDVLRCQKPDLVEKEIWMHALAYNLIRGVIAAAAEEHNEQPRSLSFKGALQAIESFRAEVGSASPDDRVRLVNVTLKMIASSVVGDRPNRVEPRAKKRRPKPHRLLTEPRRAARKRLLAKG